MTSKHNFGDADYDQERTIRKPATHKPPGAGEGSLDHEQTIRASAPNQRVFNRFSLRRMIGKGGMGVVWLAWDEQLEREVAIKFLPEMVTYNRGAVEELKRETRRALDLTHPHIVRIYDFHQSGEHAGISMEFVDGDTLSNLRVDQPEAAFDVEHIKLWITQLCDALEFAHQQAKVVHRDLKPANLMVSRNHQLKITDFGIARSLNDSFSRLTQTSATSGTAAYMSPQQMMGQKPSASDDLYALGATLYELLSSRPPFFSGDLSLQVREVKPPSIRVRREELGVQGKQAVPEEWEKTIAACLAKRMEDRPRSAREVAERLGLVPTSAQAKTAASRKLLAAVAAGLILSLGALAAYWFYPRPATPAPLAVKPAVIQPIETAVATPPPVVANPVVPTPPPPVTQPTAPAVVAKPPVAASNPVVTATPPPAAPVTPSVTSNIAVAQTPPPPTQAVTTVVTSVPAPVPAPETPKAPTPVAPPPTRTVPPEPAEGWLAITSDPPGALITIDGVTLAERSGNRVVLYRLPAGKRVRLEGRFDGSLQHLAPVSVRAEAAHGKTNAVRLEFEYGSVILVSTPTGATVKRSGVALGLTPYTNHYAAPEPATYQLEYPGYQSKQETVTPLVRQRIQHVVELRRNEPPPAAPPVVTVKEPANVPGSLEITSDPPGALITIGGESIGTTSNDKPLSYPTMNSSVEIVAAYPGLGRVTNRFSVVKGDRKPAMLSIPNASLNVTSLPPGATIWMGNKRLGITPLSVHLDTFGLVTLRAELEGLPPKTTQLEMHDRQSYQVAFVLKEAGLTLSEVAWTNSLGMVFKPVKSAGVLFSVWETRNADYETFLRAGAKPVATLLNLAQWEAKSKGFLDAKWPAPQHPAVFVCWDDANAFCLWLTRMETEAKILRPGQRYRLPRDREWSLAAELEADPGASPKQRRPSRKTTQEREFPWGGKDFAKRPGDFGNYRGILGEDRYPTTAPVGQFQPNPYGLFDLSGNVWEWCEESGNPADRKEQRLKVTRGGAWNSESVVHLDLAFRSYENERRIENSLGFRCVLELGNSR